MIHFFRRYRIHLSIAAFTLLFAVAVTGWLAFGGMEAIKEFAQRKKFDSSKWKNELKSKSPTKIRMVDDLLKHHHLEGMTKEDIDSLLGTPEKTQYFKDFDYVYWLGPERGWMGIDSEWLVLKFDAHNTVTKAKLVTD